MGVYGWRFRSSFFVLFFCFFFPCSKTKLENRKGPGLGYEEKWSRRKSKNPLTRMLNRNIPAWCCFPGFLGLFWVAFSAMVSPPSGWRAFVSAAQELADDLSCVIRWPSFQQEKAAKAAVGGWKLRKFLIPPFFQRNFHCDLYHRKVLVEKIQMTYWCTNWWRKKTGDWLQLPQIWSQSSLSGWSLSILSGWSLQKRVARLAKWFPTFSTFFPQ